MNLYTVTVNRSVLIERWYRRIFKRYFCLSIKHIVILTRNTPSHKLRLVIGLTHTSSFRWRENNRVFDVYLMCMCVCACARARMYFLSFFFFLSLVSILIKNVLSRFSFYEHNSNNDKLIKITRWFISRIWDSFLYVKIVFSVRGEFLFFSRMCRSEFYSPL